VKWFKKQKTPPTGCLSLIVILKAAPPFITALSRSIYSVLDGKSINNWMLKHLARNIYNR